MEQPKAPDYELDRYELSASACIIQTPEDYNRAGQILRTLATITKRLLKGDPETGWSGWETLVKAARHTYDHLRNMQNQHISRVEKIAEQYEAAMTQWRTTVEEKHRVKVQQVAETASAIRKELEKAARKEIRAGNPKEAQRFLDQRDLIANEPAIPDPDFTIEGVTQADEWSVEITDKMEFIKAVASGQVPLLGRINGRELPVLDIRTSIVISAAKSMGAGFNWPGVKVHRKIDYRPRAIA